MRFGSSPAPRKAVAWAAVAVGGFAVAAAAIYLTGRTRDVLVLVGLGLIVIGDVGAIVSLVVARRVRRGHQTPGDG